MGLIRFLKYCAIVGTCSLTSLVYAASVTVTGSLPRDLSSGRFDLSVTIKDVPTSEASVVGSEKSLQDKLRLFMKGDSVNFATSPDNPPAGTKFYWELRDSVDVKPNADGTTSNMAFLVRVYELDGNLAKSVSGGKLAIVGKYFKDGTEVTSGEAEIQRKIVVANQAPNGIIAVGTEQSLTFSWNTDATIAYLGENLAAATAEAPGEGVVILMRSDANITSLPAKTFSGSSAADTDGVSCTVDLNAAGSACVTCPSTATYIDTAEIESLSSADLKIKSSAGTSLVFSGLENDATYIAFAMYQPDGVQRSTCLLAQPSEDFTLSELNGEKKATPTKFHCFIATAAMGNNLGGHLERFRWFRDEVLRQSRLGTAMVNWYYRISPPIAKAIANNRAAATITRGLLYVPLVGIIGAQTWNTRPMLGVMSIGIIGFAFFIFIVQPRIRRLLLTRKTR